MATTTSSKASDKQVAYAMSLLGRSGYGNRYMHAGFKDLGATMRERSGNVEDWLRGLTKTEISTVIGKLAK